VSQTLDQRRHEVPPEVFPNLRGHVLKEIHSLTEQDPDLEWARFQGLRPATPIADPAQPEQLADRMRRLDALIAQRRRSLGLQVEPVELETVKIPDNSDYWSQRLRETQEKIAEARRPSEGEA
jgi:hypothetical protein